MYQQTLSAVRLGRPRCYLRAQAPFISITSRLHSISSVRPGVVSEPKQRAEYLSKVTGDFSHIGTDSNEYYCVDTDPTSSTPPYDYPRKSGIQLRYGGKENLALEMAKERGDAETLARNEKSAG